MANTISFCAICKDEIANIKNLLNDVLPVCEEVIIVDTGSTDGTLDVLNEMAAIHPNLQVKHFDWIDDFSAARNYSFSFATQDWVFWLDGDDRIDTKKLKHFKEWVLDNEGVDAWMLEYVYSKLPDGSPRTILTRERFLRRSKKPTWIGAIHETVAIHNMRQYTYHEMQVEHNCEGKRIEYGRNLRILEKEYKKNPNDPRTAYYVAKERFDNMKSNAKEALEHYLTLPHKYYDDECNARRRLAEIYLAEKDHGRAIRVIAEVYHLDITRRRADYYFIHARVEQDLQNYEMAIKWYDMCIMEPPPPPRVLTMEYFTWHPRRRMAECYIALGDWKNAFKYIHETEKILPGDIGNQKWINNIKSVQLDKKQGHKHVTLEFGTFMRFDSYRVGEEPFKGKLADGTVLSSKWDMSPAETPFADGSIDGVVLKGDYDSEDYQAIKKEMARIIKPGGFLWDVGTNIGFWDGSNNFNNLGHVTYQKEDLVNYVRVDNTKPTLAYIHRPTSFGPFRYRIMNLILSAKKQGYPIVDPRQSEDFDIYVSMNFNAGDEKPQRNGGNKALKVLEVCEKLDDYNQFGIGEADVVNCCSEVLADHIKQKHPGKKIINIDDHFEMPSIGWL